MPLIHTRTFRVRYYECDAYGHLNNANYLRYMQETAFDASAAAGYDMDRYAQMGRYWLVRATDIEYLKPLHYNDTLEVKTWVADFRRVSSRRMYEFRHGETGEMVARAHTDWVFLDTQTDQPAAIPDEMAAAFFPEGLPESFPAHEPFPSAPPPPPGLFSTPRKVIFSDLDMVRHVNNAVYLQYIEDCGMQVIAAHGWPVQRMLAEGFAIFVRRQQIQYRQPALLDDELQVATWASNVRRSTATRYYTITRPADGALLVRANVLGVWVDLQSGRPIRIPPHFIADFAPNLVPDAPSELSS